MSALPEKVRDDLRKILGLLESTYEDQRDAAVHAATRLLERHGLRWCAPGCQQFRHLDAWEEEFLSGLPRFPRLSPKQANQLLAIYTRLRAAGCRI